MLSTMITIPSSTDVIANVASYSNPWFNELLPFMYIGIGILLAVLVILWLKGTIAGGINKLFRSENELPLSRDMNDWDFARSMFNQRNKK